MSRAPPARSTAACDVSSAWAPSDWPSGGRGGSVDEAERWLRDAGRAPPRDRTNPRASASRAPQKGTTIRPLRWSAWSAPVRTRHSASSTVAGRGVGAKEGVGSESTTSASATTEGASTTEYASHARGPPPPRQSSDCPFSRSVPSRFVAAAFAAESGQDVPDLLCRRRARVVRVAHSARRRAPPPPRPARSERITERVTGFRHSELREVPIPHGSRHAADVQREAWTSGSSVRPSTSVPLGLPRSVTNSRPSPSIWNSACRPETVPRGSTASLSGALCHDERRAGAVGEPDAGPRRGRRDARPRGGGPRYRRRKAPGEGRRWWSGWWSGW